VEIPLVVPFCSQPFPELVSARTSYGTRFDLPAGEFGNAGSLTAVFGDLFLSQENRWRVEGFDHYFSSMKDLYTPTELAAGG
jgi:hypothetical protein